MSTRRSASNLRRARVRSAAGGRALPPPQRAAVTAPGADLSPLTTLAVFFVFHWTCGGARRRRAGRRVARPAPRRAICSFVSRRKMRGADRPLRLYLKPANPRSRIVCLNSRTKRSADSVTRAASLTRAVRMSPLRSLCFRTFSMALSSTASPPPQSQSELKKPWSTSARSTSRFAAGSSFDGVAPMPPHRGLLRTARPDARDATMTDPPRDAGSHHHGTAPGAAPGSPGAVDKRVRRGAGGRGSLGVRCHSPRPSQRRSAPS